MNQKTLTYFLLILLAIVWGTSFILIKRGLVSFSPIQLASLRLTFAGLVLLPLLIKDLSKIRKENILAFMVIAVFGNLIPYFLFAYAETKMDSSIVGALNGLTPFFTFIISYYVFKTGSTMTQVIGILVGLIGAVLLVTDGNPLQLMSMNPYYSLMVAGACLCYAISVNTVKAKLADVSPLLAASFPLVLVLVIALPVALFTGVMDVLSTDEKGLESLGYIAILGIIGTALAIVLFNKLIQMTSAVTASSVTYLIPIVAFFWGWVDGENLVWENIIALLLILSGVYLVKNKKALPLTE